MTLIFNKVCFHDFRRAATFEHAAFSDSMVLNAKVYPNWIKDSNHFWYIRKSRVNDGGSGGIAERISLG